MTHLYLEPIGIVAGMAGRAALAAGEALPLAGGPLAFTAARVLEAEAGNAAARIVSARALARIHDGELVALREQVTAPRAVPGLDLSRPRIMGIVNVTPDSFSDGGFHDDPTAAIAHARMLVAEGADILDIGGESTRPGADAVALDIERARAMPVVSAMLAQGACVSLDTRKADLMREACAMGVTMINDVSALTHDADAGAALAGKDAAVVLMHARGVPKTMQDDPRYGDVALEVYDALAGHIAAAEAAGIARARLIADPGIGFGKTFDHNVALMARLTLFHGLGVPLLLGASRKGFIGKITGVAVAAQRLSGSLAMALAAVGRGVQIVRVHDVRQTREALQAHLAVEGGFD